MRGWLIVPKKISRREFLKTTGKGVASATGLTSFVLLLNIGTTYRFKPLYHVSKKVEEMKRGWKEGFILRPPGARGEEDFLSKCIKCYLCLEACPIQAIKIAGREQGKAVDTPYIIPEVTGCDLCLTRDKQRCNYRCPTNALEKIDNDKENVFKKMKMGETLNMGIAILDKRVCYAWTEVSVCWACYEICPYKGRAITTGFKNKPTFWVENCVGCGLCVEICPVPQKAIKMVSQGSVEEARSSLTEPLEKDSDRWSFRVDETKTIEEGFKKEQRTVESGAIPVQPEKGGEERSGDDWQPTISPDLLLLK